MKIAIYVFIALAIVLIIYNATILDFSNLLEGDSMVAVISILAALCVIVLMLILAISRKIEKKQR